MPESPVRMKNGPTASGSVTSIQKEFQQKFLQGDGSPFASGDNEREQLERLLKQNNPNLAKKYIRASDWAPNHAVRGQLWIRLCKRLTSEAEWTHSVQHYKETLPDVYKKVDSSCRSIPLPVFTDLSMTQTYYLNEDGRYKCQKILTMIEANQPQITYAPALYPLTALFLHFIQDEAEVFACLDALLRPKRTGKFFMGDTVGSWNSASHVMAELVRRRMKAIYNFILHSMEADRRDSLFDNWLKWIFVDLPFEMVIRVVDCYLYEGMKVLFRSGLALMKLFYKSAGRPYSMPNLAQSISQFCQEFQKHSSATELLKVGFAFARLSQDDLISMIQRYEETVQSSPTARKQPPGGEADPDYHGIHRRSISVPASLIPSEIVKMSRILKEEQFYALWQWLPLRYQIGQPTPLFTSEEHGNSLVTFFQQTGANEPTILLVKTRNDDIFGAFCSHSWENRFNGGKSLSYFGTGESFLFSLYPNQRLYSWIGLGQSEAPPRASSLFMAADATSLIIGGGGGFALRFDSTLAQGRTEPCTTFASPCLCSNGKEDFECSIVEAFGFIG